MKIEINLRQAQALEAANRGEVHRDETTMRWLTTSGYAITASADVLVRKNLITPATTITDNRYRQAVITTRGRQTLDELASRAPDHGEPTAAPEPEYTAAQLRVLKAATRGRVSQADDAKTWREYPENGRAGTRLGRAVTQIVERLIARGVARKCTELVDGRRPLIVTADGYELLSENAHRG